ncbi:hypothetical protein K443DRAFT_4292 [Laccaria amethystina LaAM-08-1]|uniref:Uncharacterized protein n=1 Tax=Laccaria amethystina LaAM-08-1 TaxID=1095629 RepID=A0A0C9WYR4_9AGAR|nr:hypothetical protein K443DRAFT_4292 [Laccaria amethystina LaAM-08-1]
MLSPPATQPAPSAPTQVCGALLEQYSMRGHLVSYVIKPVNKKKGLALNRLQNLAMPNLKFSFLLPQPLKLPLQPAEIMQRSIHRMASLSKTKMRSGCSIFMKLFKMVRMAMSHMEYDGQGIIQARSTRDNHRLDDQRLARSGGSTGPSRNHLPGFAGESRHSMTISSAPNSGHSESGSETSNWLNLVIQEIDIISDLPVTSPTSPLVFINGPLCNGEFMLGSDLELIQPNTGLHRLQPSMKANRAFLDTEG